MAEGKVKSIEKFQKVPEVSARQSGTGVHQAASDACLIQQMAGNQAIQQLFRSGAIQAKLTVSQLGDPDEQEADRVADQVMRKEETIPISSAPGAIQRKSTYSIIQRQSSQGHEDKINPVDDNIAGLTIRQARDVEQSVQPYPLGALNQLKKPRPNIESAQELSARGAANILDFLQKNKVTTRAKELLLSAASQENIVVESLSIIKLPFQSKIAAVELNFKDALGKLEYVHKESTEAAYEKAKKKLPEWNLKVTDEALLRHQYGPLTDSQRDELLAVHINPLRALVKEIEAQKPNLPSIRARSMSLGPGLRDFINTYSPSVRLIGDLHPAAQAEDKAFEQLGAILNPLIVTTTRMRELLMEAHGFILQAKNLPARHDPNDAETGNPPPTKLSPEAERQTKNAPPTTLTPLRKAQSCDRCMIRTVPQPISPASGTPLPEQVRISMEGQLGADFSDVRIHHGEQAPALGAIAYTQGNDIHFAPGLFDSASHAGRKLLAHELTHVIQQREGRVPAPAGVGMEINDDVTLETEADRAGDNVASAVLSHQAIPSNIGTRQTPNNGALQRHLAPLRRGSVSVDMIHTWGYGVVQRQPIPSEPIRPQPGDALKVIDSGVVGDIPYNRGDMVYVVDWPEPSLTALVQFHAPYKDAYKPFRLPKTLLSPISSGIAPPGKSIEPPQNAFPGEPWPSKTHPTTHYIGPRSPITQDWLQAQGYRWIYTKEFDKHHFQEYWVHPETGDEVYRYVSSASDVEPTPSTEQPGDEKQPPKIEDPIEQLIEVEKLLQELHEDEEALYRCSDNLRKLVGQPTYEKAYNECWKQSLDFAEKIGRLNGAILVIDRSRLNDDQRAELDSAKSEANDYSEFLMQLYQQLFGGLPRPASADDETRKRLEKYENAKQ